MRSGETEVGVEFASEDKHGWIGERGPNDEVAQRVTHKTERHIQGKTEAEIKYYNDRLPT